MVLKKKGQQAVGMSFGMMFAIFLIVVFIIVAFIAVKSFLNISECSQVGMFYDDLQKGVNNAVREQESNSNFVIKLPGDIKKVCFANLSMPITNPGDDYDAIADLDFFNANVFLLPPSKACDMEWKLIDRLDIDKITKNKNPYCVEADSAIKIKKGFYSRLVWIE